MRTFSVLLSVTIILSVSNAAQGTEVQDMLKFEKIRISDVTYEAASAADINKNGVLDIVSGEYWFEGPGFKKRHKMCDVQRADDYYDDFGDVPMDVNGNGYPDVVTGGWWGKTLRWRENPKGEAVEWKVHDICETGSVERLCCWDIDGDGFPEAVPNCPGQPFVAFKLARDKDGKGAGRFDRHLLCRTPQGHGLGCGDITGNGRPDLVSAAGWLEAPEDPLSDKWAWHPDFDLGSASVPVLVYDVNGDGINDLIVGQGHAYGLAWWEQRKDGDGNRTWIKHDIDTERSQYHDMRLDDIDNDGQPELITGKRYRAHCGHDPGSADPVGIYYFKINGGVFERHTLDYGAPGDGASGAGIYLWVEDLDGNGWKDIIAPGKEGLYLFKNLGPM